MNDRCLLSLLNVRENDEKTNFEIGQFENIMNITLPKIFKCFYRTYSLGANSFRSRDSYLHSSGRKLLISQKTDIRKDDILLTAIESIMNLGEIKDSLINYIDDGILKEALLPIMYIDNSLMVCVGFGQNNQDQIFLFNSDKISSGRFQLVGNNVFDFLKNIWIIDDSEEIIYENLFKNWNEDFWRYK